MAEQASVISEASEVAAVDAAAAKEQADAAAASKVTESPASQSTGKTTDNPAAAIKPVFDAQKSYDELQRSHKELQKFSTQTAQERAELRKQLQDLHQKQEKLLEMISKATEAPFDPEQFKREFDQKGPAALDAHLQKFWEKREAALRVDYDKTVSELRGDNLAMKTAVTVMRMNGDEEKFPNFSALYPKMIEIAKAENCPVDLTKPTEEVLAALYSQAKSQSGEEAVQIAAAEAKKRAEAEAAKEAKSATATGGKRGTAPTPNLDTMPLDDLEKLVIQQHGIAEER